MGSPRFAACASLRDARRKIHHRFVCHWRRLKIHQDRNVAQKYVWRAEIVLFTADGAGRKEIMRRTCKSKTCVWRCRNASWKNGSGSASRQNSALADQAARWRGGRAGCRPDAWRSPGETSHGPASRWRRRRASVLVPSNGSGAASLQPNRVASSSLPTTHALLTNRATWSGSMSIRQLTPVLSLDEKANPALHPTQPACRGESSPPEP